MRIAGLQVSTPGDREIVLKRDFDAPRAVVFEAFVRPELVRRWLLGPPGHEMPACRIDPRVGGTFEYEWRNVETGESLVCTGEFREVERPARIVHTERFDMSGTKNPVPMGGDTVVTTLFAATDTNEKTAVTMRCRYPSREIRDGVLAHGMVHGVEAGYARLDALLTGSAENGIDLR